MYTDKAQLLSYFRTISSTKLAYIQRKTKDYRTQASLINNCIKNVKEQRILGVLDQAKIERWNNSDILEAVLMITYAADIVMLESRNDVWPYEYMAFARRIGELWEPFCKEAFKYPVKDLDLNNPPNFEEVREEIIESIKKYISFLNVESTIKRDLMYYYQIPWKMVDSGRVKLGLDLHFSQAGFHYNCDFKSGFSSNEKGNTNRLLMVATIYHFISHKEKMILFVRQAEKQNNHYLQTLKNSNYWEAYCADEAYTKIFEFTGFDLRKWLDMNAFWEQDISDEFRNHLSKNDLLKYLTW